MISQPEVLRRLEQIVARVDSGLVLDRAAVWHVDEPYPGFEYALRLGEAGALLFIADADLEAADWESRLFKRLEAAQRYLEQFPLARR
jgi:hypothetical protein